MEAVLIYQQILLLSQNYKHGTRAMWGYRSEYLLNHAASVPVPDLANHQLGGGHALATPRRSPLPPSLESHDTMSTTVSTVSSLLKHLYHNSLDISKDIWFQHTPSVLAEGLDGSLLTRRRTAETMDTKRFLYNDWVPRGVRSRV